MAFGNMLSKLAQARTSNPSPMSKGMGMMKQGKPGKAKGFGNLLTKLASKRKLKPSMGGASNPRPNKMSNMEF